MSFSGTSWRAGLAASDLICDGTVPPFIVVGIDHGGAWRSYDYLPCKPGTGAGNVRPVLSRSQRSIFPQHASAAASPTCMLPQPCKRTMRGQRRCAEVFHRSVVYRSPIGSLSIAPL